jgi:hypothetical protein
MALLVRGGVLALILAVVGCGGSSGGAGGSAGNDCTLVPVADNTNFGCNIRLTQPVGCQTIDLTNGKTATLEWVTDNTVCNTPWHLCVGGSPSSFTPPGTNAGCVDLSVNGANITAKTAIYEVSAAGLAASGLTSTSGVYYWTVYNYSWTSNPATAAFRVIK